MEGNPRVAYMLEHGELPHWVKVARQQEEQAEQEAREARKARAVEEALLPTPTPASRGRHRFPRRWRDWPAQAIGTALLLGLTAAEAVGQSVLQSAGPLI